MNGKGSKLRPMFVDASKFESNWRKVFSDDLHTTCCKAVGERVRYVGTNGDEFDKIRHGLPVEGEGLCLEQHDSHGLCIIVLHDDHTTICVDPISVEIIGD